MRQETKTTKQETKTAKQEAKTMKAKILLSTYVLATAAATAAMGCATTAPGARPDDMSAAEHRKAAQMDKRKAAEEEQRYDPEAAVVGRNSSQWDREFFPQRIYNPTEKHRWQAVEHRDHARQHREAAQELEAFEEEECAAFPDSTRAASPLVGRVQRVVNIEDGARLYLSDDFPTNVVVAHMQCHMAFGRKVGREGMSDCPLYLKGIHVEAAGKNSVDITSSDQAVVKQIRQRSHGLVVGG